MYGIVSSKIYDKRVDFNLEIVNFPFLDGDMFNLMRSMTLTSSKGQGLTIKNSLISDCYQNILNILLRPGMLCKPRCSKIVIQFKRAQLK